MGTRWLFAAAAFVLLADAQRAAASPADDFKSAFAMAEAAEKEAAALKNRWTTTEQSLAEARKAAAAGDYEGALAQARRAEALAKASVAQAQEQQQAWRAAVIH